MIDQTLQKDIITLDGSQLEGGGQLLRNAVSLSALLGKPIRVDNIRANRDQPGLKAQHMEGIRLVADFCNAKVIGLKKGSSTIEFIPSTGIRAGSYKADPGTAGSTALLLQVAMPCVLFSENAEEAPSSCLTLVGGTNALAAPQIDYTAEIFLPFLRHRFHAPSDLRLNIISRGYWPKGGGRIIVDVPALAPIANEAGAQPTTLSPLTVIERGEITLIKGRSYAAGLPPAFARKMAVAATECLRDYPAIKEVPIQIEVLRENPKQHIGAGSGIFLYAETTCGCRIAGSAVGQKGTSQEVTGQLAAEELLRGLKTGACVDEYLQDQMIIFMALAKGKSSVLTGPLTLHTKTAIWISEQLTSARFKLEEKKNDCVLVTCAGIGYHANIT